MSTKSRRHTHKYYKVDMGGTNVWACASPDCLHYMPKHMEHMVPGKASICWGCGDTMILTLQNMKDKQPKCPDCSGMRELASFIDSKLNAEPK